MCEFSLTGFVQDTKTKSKLFLIEGLMNDIASILDFSNLLLDISGRSAKQNSEE